MTTDAVSFTIVVDDRPARTGLTTAHGFSCWIEAEDICVLFDTGPDGGILRYNLDALGKNVAFLDALVISHGHADHGGGLEWLLTRRPDLPVFIHADAMGGHYSGGCPAGLSPEACSLLRASDLHLVDGWEEVAPGFAVTGPVPRRTAFERITARFTRDAAGNIPDPLDDDISLVVETPAGPMVVTGCAHAGLINILDYVREHRPDDPVHGFVGGTHLVGADQERLRATADRLDRMDLGCMAPCHCSGEGIAFLQSAFPGRYQPVASGITLEVGGG